MLPKLWRALSVIQLMKKNITFKNKVKIYFWCNREWLKCYNATNTVVTDSQLLNNTL